MPPRWSSARWLVPLAFLALSCGAPEGPDDGEGDVATAAEEISASRATVAPIHAGNALTLPAQRHLVRAGGSYLLALQQGGQGGRGLGFYRSDDGGSSWRYLAPIQGNAAHADTADLVVVGSDVALVYSYEGPTLAGSTAHDVFFQWWRYRSSDNSWTPSTPIRVFDSTSSSTAYYRAEIARDSHTRLWVQAWKLEADGTSTARVAVSVDNGNSFQPHAALATLRYRGGGRIIHLGTRILFVYDGHEAGAQPARFRVHEDARTIDDWGPTTVAFSEGIYHGAALSAVADGRGGLHLVYKDKAERLYYRRFDGSAFGTRTLIDATGGWEVQPAITRLGNDLAIFYNRAVTSSTDDEVFYRVLRAGVLGSAQLVDGTVSYKGYPAAAEVLPSTSATVPAFFCVTPGSGSGNAVLYRVGWGG